MRAKPFLCFNNNRIQGEDLVPVKYIYALSVFGCRLFQGGGSVVIDSLFIVAPIVCLFLT